MRTVGVGLLQLMLAFAASLQFLTRLPVPIRTTGSDAEFRRSTIFFPAAGLIIGAIVAVAGYGFSFIFPVYVNAILILGLWTFLSGALHLDGLMDSADALLSHRSPERMLEIMKDSRVGAMGVIVCVLYLLLKMSLIHHLLTSGGVEGLFALAVIPVWSRAFMATAIAGWPYARSGPGLGQLFRTVKGKHAMGAAWVAGVLSLLVVGFGVEWSGVWNTGINSIVESWDLDGFGLGELLEKVTFLAIMAVVTYVVGSLIAAAISRKLGGLTGDIYGALNEIIEVALLLMLVGWMFA